MAKSRAEIARNNLLEDISKEKAKSNPNKRVLDRLQRQLKRVTGKAGMLVGEPKPAGMLVGKPKRSGMLVGEPKPAGMLVGKPKRSGMLVGEPKPAGMLVGEPKPAGMLVGKPSRSTADATPRGKPPVSRRPTVGGNMMGGTPPSGGTLSKKDVDEYSEAFASPDASKMYDLSEKNRRKDMNMLERAFDSIKVAGDRATADRRRRGLSDYDMTQEEMIYDAVGAAKKGGRVKTAMNGNKTKNPSTSKRKRAALRGFGVETRGS